MTDEEDVEEDNDEAGSIAGGSGEGLAPTRKRTREGSSDSDSFSEPSSVVSTSRGRGRGRGSRGRGSRGRGSRGRGSRGRGSRGRGSQGRGGRGRGGWGRGQVSAGQGSDSDSTEDGPTPKEGYDEQDGQNVIPPFTPKQPPGIHFERAVLRGAMTTELEFFLLFLTPEIISDIATHSNKYLQTKLADRRYSRTSPEEIEKLIALLIYFSLVRVDSDVERYWSTKSLYHGLWARKMLSRDRFKAIMAFLHVVDPDAETPGDKLRKVESFISSFKDRCKLMYQPSQSIAVDERMVKSKHRSGIRQFMKDKPTKWGIKIWVLADSKNGYTIDFNVYVGKAAAEGTSEHGLGYDVVMKLMEPYLGQGYHLYLDNYYTSPRLVSDLFLHGTPSVGTGKLLRTGIPECMKNVKEWARKKQRGSLRWYRESSILYLQWVDSKPVTLLTTLGSANEAVSCTRRMKRNGKFEKVSIPQPLDIHRYNQHMNAVDRSDQMLAYHNIRRKCYRWWKTLFFHLTDIAVVNGFILFQQHREQHPEALDRNRKYSVVEFREAVIRQLCGFEEYERPPVYDQPRQIPTQFDTVHLPRMGDAHRNCVVCYREGRGERKVKTYCSAPQCQKYLHIRADLDCFGVWHSGQYHRG